MAPARSAGRACRSARCATSSVIFDGVPVSSLRRVGMLGNSTGPIALALFVALGERQGVDR